MQNKDNVRFLFSSFLDEIVQGALADDGYQKLYPGIASEVLLENLIKFVHNINNRPTEDGIDHGKLYKKANGRQIDSSRRYYLVKEPNLDEFNLYAKITKGRNLGYYRVFTNECEVKLLIEYGLNYLKQHGTLLIVADYVKFVQDSKYLISRERCEFISRILNNNVAVTRNSSKVDYDVTKLGTRQQQTQKRPTALAATTTVSSSMLPSTDPSLTPKQVLLSTTTSLSPTADKSTSRSRSSSAERCPSPLPKKQTYRKLMKNHEQLLSSKTPIKKAAPPSSLYSTPIAKRLRTMTNGTTTISLSSSTLSSQPVLTATQSKKKQAVSVKKRNHLSKDEEDDNDKPVLRM
ncbi:unnamed protein product [Rotaria sp. Silwood2]|nr:unnamed protein product [Rotaria sp. Silwood2]